MASKEQTRRSKRSLLHDDIEDDLSIKIPRFEELEDEDKKGNSLSPGVGSIGARRESRVGQDKPAELFRKDLISAMKLPDTEQLQPDNYVFISDAWRQDWERGVQVPVNPEVVNRQFTIRKVDGNEKMHGAYAFKFPKKFLHATNDENYKQGIHELHETQKLAEQVCRYDLDDLDVVWLNNLNTERQNMGMEPVLEWSMEHIMEEIENQCYNNMQNMIKTVEGLGIEYDENVVCDVCRSPEGEDNNEIVFCDGCDLCVHQACYGIQKIPEGSWLCRTCALGIQPKCILCPKTGGAMKSTKSGSKWAHVSCALWIPEVSIGCPEKMEPVTKISQIPSSRWSLICNICRERDGACIQCSVKTCKTAFHVTCAFNDNLFMKTVLDEAHDDVQLKAYCGKHTRRKDGDSTPRKEPVTPTKRENILLREPGTPMKKESEMTEEEKKELRSYRLNKLAEEFYSCVETSEVAEALKMDELTIDFFINYWVLKRKANFNKPLLMPKTEEADMLLKQREDSLIARMKMFIHLRQDLERVRNLCYMVSRREKIRRSLYAMKEEIITTQMAAVDSIDRTARSETRDWCLISGAHKMPETMYDRYDDILYKAQLVDAEARREAREQSEEPKPSTSATDQEGKKPGRDNKRRQALKEASRAKRALLASKVDKSRDSSSSDGEVNVEMGCEALPSVSVTVKPRVPPIKILARQLDRRNEIDFEETKVKTAENTPSSCSKKTKFSEFDFDETEIEAKGTTPISYTKKTRRSESQVSFQQTKEATSLTSKSDTALLSKQSQEESAAASPLRRSTRQKDTSGTDIEKPNDSSSGGKDVKSEISHSEGLTLRIRTRDSCSKAELVSTEDGKSPSKGSLSPKHTPKRTGGKVIIEGKIEASPVEKCTVAKSEVPIKVEKLEQDDQPIKSEIPDEDVDVVSIESPESISKCSKKLCISSSEDDSVTSSNTVISSKRCVRSLSRRSQTPQDTSDIAHKQSPLRDHRSRRKRHSNEPKSSDINSDKSDTKLVIEPSLPPPKIHMDSSDSSKDVHSAKESSVSPKRTKRRSDGSVGKLGGNGTSLPRVEVSVDDTTGRISLRLRNNLEPKSDTDESGHEKALSPVSVQKEHVHRQSLDSALLKAKQLDCDKQSKARRSSSRLRSLGINGLVEPSQLVIGKDIKDKVHSRLGRLRGNHIRRTSLQNGILEGTPLKLGQMLSRRKSMSASSDDCDVLGEGHVLAKENHPENGPLLAKFHPMNVERTRRKSVLSPPISNMDQASGHSTPDSRSVCHIDTKLTPNHDNTNGSISVTSSRNSSPDREANYSLRKNRNFPISRSSIENALSHKLISQSRSSSVDLSDSESEVNLLRVPDSDSDYAPSENSDCSSSRRRTRGNSRTVLLDEASRDSTASSIRSSSRHSRNSWPKFHSLQS